jgi:antitoxin component of MazEF toxin-antitoxin module
MARMFKAKVRNVGTSLGVLIPKEVAEEEKVKTGEEIEVTIMRRNVRNVMKLFGTAKTANEFERDHAEREL